VVPVDVLVKCNWPQSLLRFKSFLYNRVPNTAIFTACITAISIQDCLGNILEDRDCPLRLS
jgi:hypothetical protein